MDIDSLSDRTKISLSILLLGTYLGLVGYAAWSGDATADLLVDLAFAVFMGGFGVVTFTEDGGVWLRASAMALVGAGLTQLYVSLVPNPVFGDGVPGTLAVAGVAAYLYARGRGGGE